MKQLNSFVTIWIEGKKNIRKVTNFAGVLVKWDVDKFNYLFKIGIFLLHGCVQIVLL